MLKALCVAGAVVAILLIIVFGLDLVAGFPFGRTSEVLDIGFLLCALALGYMSWATFLEQT
jgi:hypothetical protein